MKQTLLLIVFALLATACCKKAQLVDPPANGQVKQTADNKNEPRAIAETTLLNNNLDAWKKINFGGEGDIYIKDGVLNIDMAIELSGISYRGDAKKIFGPSLENYQITLDAQLRDGQDIFLGLTFPVGKAGHVSLVLGGWAGAVTGLSNLDGLNASENKTTKYKAFNPDRWYKVKVRVTADKIECWLDKEKIVDVKRADYTKYDTHGSVVDTKPFGLFTYESWGAYRNIKVTRFK